MEQRFDFGAAVRLTRNVRNDGTFPGLDVGTLLIRRGSIGHVINVGTFLQDQVIYTVNFLEAGRIVGCREEELIDAETPWINSRYETREKVRAKRGLAVNGELLVAAGDIGEIFKVIRPQGTQEAQVRYHVHFADGRLLQVPEDLLAPVSGELT